jgi:hypothetical protein
VEPEEAAAAPTWALVADVIVPIAAGGAPLTGIKNKV